MGDGDCFVAQDRRPASIGPLDPDALSPRTRALLFLPDLVTDFLEASFGEPITVTCLSQSVRSDLVDQDLGAAAGDSVVVRESVIFGAKSSNSKPEYFCSTFQSPSAFNSSMML